MAIKAIIFDLDGTLIDSEHLFVEVLQNHLAKQGYKLSAKELCDICWGRSWQGIYQELLKRQKTSYIHVEAMTTEVDQFIEDKKLRLPPIKGSVKLVKNLYRQFPLCIVSGSTRAQIAHAAESCRISHCFDFYLGAEDYVHGKPSPECYLKAAKKLNLHPRECLVFEDSEAGVEAAKKAGMYCVALASRNGFNLSAADKIMTSLEAFQVDSLQLCAVH